MKHVRSHSMGSAARLFQGMPERLDLRDEASLEGLLATADALMSRSHSLEGLLDLEFLMASSRDDWPMAAHVAVKLARSKALLHARNRPLDLSVVIAVYGEHERILAPHEHPNGEGFLDRKLRQLAWLTHGLSRARYDLTIVDDGCPHGSGDLAREILTARHRRAAARVLFLADAIREGHPLVRRMHSTDESRKGGAIQLGLYHATQRFRPGQVAMFTDADLSTHLGQSGLLVHALDHPGKDVAVGSRRTSTSIVVKSAARSTRGRLFIYLWKKLLPEIGYVHDTQCGFKAFRGAVARTLVCQSRVHDFAFDLELLMRAERRRPASIAAVPIAWIDSEASSTTVALAPYLAMLRATAELQRSLGTGGAEQEDFARAIDSLDESAWDDAVRDLGPKLVPYDTALDREARWVDAAELVRMSA